MDFEKIKLKKPVEELLEFGNSEKARILQKFFKTERGQYGEGDIFLGVKIWDLRKIIKNYLNLKLSEIEKLLKSPIHEHRLAGILILVNKYEKSKEKKKFFDFYLKNIRSINNWDLVDISAPNIIGNFLAEKDKGVLYELAASDDLWKKRIAMLSTFSFIRKNKYKDTLKIAEILLHDKHDLIHKAVGWMLREVGKRNLKTLENFLKKNYKNIPRTTLRYAIEKFPEEERKKWLKGELK